MNREENLANLEDSSLLWDIIIIGGGATGLGIAVDSAARGFRTLLLEKHDFAKGTSSRSTKLIHGGLRYLQQGNLSLVKEALKERGLLCKNAPHLVFHQSFLVPSYHFWEGPFYGMGVKLYDLLAGKLGLETSHFLSKEETIKMIPNIQTKDLRGGLVYYDGQFDDARLAITLARTSADLGAVLFNYMSVESFIKENGKIKGVLAKDELSQKTYKLFAPSVINATGVFTDQLRKMDDPLAPELIVPSQGIHLVLDRSFISSDTALLIPRTKDGRVIFLVPWLNHLLIGTTDTPLKKIEIEPSFLEEEIDLLLAHAGEYLEKKPTRGDILSVFAGIRPLVAVKNAKKTSEIKRDHHIEVSDSSLISICGGKWTTYRKMAEDAVTKAIEVGSLPKRACKTEKLKLHGYLEEVSKEDPLHQYGSDQEIIKTIFKENPEASKQLHPSFSYTQAEVIFAARFEMAQSIEDVLARRTRMLFLDVKASLLAAPIVCDLLAKELKKDNVWKKNQMNAYSLLCDKYLIKK